METLQTGILFSSGAERVTWFSTRPTFTIFGFSEASTQILAIQYLATLWGWMGLFSGNVSHSCSLPMKSGCDWIFFYAAENFRRVMTIRAMRTEAPRRAARTMAATAPGPREPAEGITKTCNVCVWLSCHTLYINNWFYLYVQFCYRTGGETQISLILI